MVKDFIHDDEWDFTEEEHLPEPPKVKKSPPPGGGGTSMKDYLIVGLIAIIAVMGINNYIFARTAPPAGAASGGGGCCGGGGGGTAGLATADLEQIGLDYYVQATGEENVDSVEAKVEDFGCHQEIHIYKDGQLVMKVGYASGEAYEL